jgi:hypothetical protein
MKISEIRVAKAMRVFSIHEFNFHLLVITWRSIESFAGFLFVVRRIAPAHEIIDI